MNPTSKLSAGVGALLAIILTVVALLVVRSPNVPATGGAAGPGAGTAGVGASPGLGQKPPRTATFEDVQTGRVSDAPTADKAQSKLWFAGGSWWAVMLEPKSQTFRIHGLDWATQEWKDTGTEVDARPFAKADALWDGTKLYIASAGTLGYRGHAALLMRYSFDAAKATWTRDRGFPVQMTDHGVGSIVIDRDGTGKLWAAYLDHGNLVVNRSIGDDARWGKPFNLPIAGVDATAARATLVAAGGRVSVIWSNSAEDAVYLAVHNDGAADEQWASGKTVVAGAREADDHLNAKAAVVDGETRIYVAVKTSLDVRPNRNENDAQMLLLEIRPDGTVRKYLAGRVRDQHTRPVILIDGETHTLYLLATSPFGGGRVYYKRTSLEQISFVAGRGSIIVESDADPKINDATATKQTLNAETGLVVLAFDRTTGRYLHGVLNLGGPDWKAESRRGEGGGAGASPGAGAPDASAGAAESLPVEEPTANPLASETPPPSEAPAVLLPTIAPSPGG
ncbi:MAG: hypothetical protein ACJ77F_14340 [Chloroflexota bacterium]